MKNILIYIALTYFACALLACKNEQLKIRRFSTEKFKETITLKGRLFSLKEVVKPVDIKAIPEYNLIIVLESSGKSEYLARAYSMDSFNLIKKFVKYGSEEDELIVATNLRYDKKLKEILITDPVKQIIYFYSIDSIRNPNRIVNASGLIDLHSSFKLRNEYLRRPLVLNNKIIDLRTNKPDSLVNIFNIFTKSGVLLSHLGMYPENNYSNAELNQIYASGLNISDDQKYLILNYFNTDVIDLYDTSGHLMQRTQGPDGFDPEFRKKSLGAEFMSMPTKKSHRGFIGHAKMKDSLVFILYSGLLIQSGEYHTTKLFKLNSQLDPLTYYKLDYPVFDFDICWENRKIYALSHKPKASVIIYNF